MDLFLFWALLGALIGIAAAQRKGWNLAAGVIGGILLGPFAILMFAMSGLVSSSESKRKKCEFCREWMWADATVCPKCQRQVTSSAPPAAIAVPATVPAPPPAAPHAASTPAPRNQNFKPLPPQLQPSRVSRGAVLIAVLTLVAAGWLVWWLVQRAERNAAAEREAAVAAVVAEYSDLRSSKPQAPAQTTAPPPRSGGPSPLSASLDRLGEEAELASTRLRVLRLERELATAQDETRRYREGLERAVAELNRMRQAGVPSQPEYTPPAAPAPRARVAQYTPPQVAVSDSGILVAGRLWNSGDADAHGSITIELLLDGRVYDSTRQDMMVPARSEMAYSHTFFRGVTVGNYTARVTPSY